MDDTQLYQILTYIVGIVCILLIGNKNTVNKSIDYTLYQVAEACEILRTKLLTFTYHVFVGSELSLGWVDLRVWLGRVGSKFFSFQCAGLDCLTVRKLVCF